MSVPNLFGETRPRMTPAQIKARVARLRRIVRNGEALAKLIGQMRKDVYAEFTDQIRGTDRWEQRRDDYWDDLDRHYGNLQRMMPGKTEMARRELRGLGEPESVTRSKPEPENPPKREEEGHSPLLIAALKEFGDREFDEAICNL